MSDSYDSLTKAFGYHPQNPKPKEYDRGLVIATLAEKQCFFTGSSCMTCLSAIPEYPHELPWVPNRAATSFCGNVRRRYRCYSPWLHFKSMVNGSG